MLGSVSKRPICWRKCQVCQVQQTQQTRAATLIRRPRRPYTFTQLITLSDGSTFLHRTTSPAAVYKSVKDTKNHVLWNPSSQKLLNTEEDEAGRLKQFRSRFGRGWDSEISDNVEEAGEPSDSLVDLMSAAAEEDTRKQDKKAANEASDTDKMSQIKER